MALSCRHFKPEFEKIARYLIAKSPSGTNKVFVYRVDCATEVRIPSNVWPLEEIAVVVVAGKQQQIPCQQQKVHSSSDTRLPST